jgi:hypothetical protein
MFEDPPKVAQEKLRKQGLSLMLQSIVEDFKVSLTLSGRYRGGKHGL